MKLKKAIEQINVNILEGQIDLAEAELKALTPSTLAEQRMQSHYQALIQFHRGHINLARQQMELSAQKFGENVNLLRDLLVCQYHLQDMSGFRANLNRLEQQLIENKEFLCQQSLFECQLMLGKFLEEEARLSPALEYYELAMTNATTPVQRLRTLIQKSRWHGLYEPSGQLSSFYRELISVARGQLTKDLHIELEHSLMLIELRLIGTDHAYQRIVRLGTSIAEIDQRLMCFDFVEGALTQDLEIEPQVIDKMDSFESPDPYEQFVRKIVKGKLEASEKIHELALLSPFLPWGSYLRLLCLAANMESSHSTRLELNRKIQLIIRSLDPASQGLWTRRLKQALQTPEVRVEYSFNKRSVMVQGRLVDLSKKKMGMQLLEGLTRKPELSVDEAIRLLWQSSFSPEHYHRLRMGIHRLNTLINKVTGLGKIIEVDSQHVRLRPEVKIRHADEGFETEIIGL